MKDVYGGGGASWMGEEEHLPSMTCPFPAFGGCKKCKYKVKP